MTRAWKLLVLIAVLLLPLGMAPAGAVAAHAPMAMGMASGHCPDQDSHHPAKGGIAECTMACAGALPAADLARHEPLLVIHETIQPAPAHRLNDLHPDIATPPPKHS